ncbi:MAG: hypothetical protein E3J72_07250 [Planctomycetota bacterium]|nr:MAG: hypothetical protein E3J72_07250 [Planctomycetota bacterium]
MRQVVVTVMFITMLLGAADAAFAGEPGGRGAVPIEIRRNSYLQDAQKYYDAEKWVDCIKACEDYLETWTSELPGLQAAPDVALWLGVSHLGNNNQFQAEKYLGDAMKLDRDWAKPHAHMAVIYAKSGFLAKMRTSLLDAAKRGYDIMAFIKTSNEQAIKQLSGDTGFILDVLNKEKFDFSELSHDPFDVPLQQVSEVARTGPDPTEQKPEEILTIEEQRRITDDAYRLWGELAIKLDKIRQGEEVNVSELLDIVSKLQGILDLGRERQFTDVEQKRRLNELRRRLEDPETRDMLRTVRLQLFKRGGEDILDKMVQRLENDEYLKVYALYNRLAQHVRAVPYKDLEFKENAHWLSTEGGKIDTKAKIRERFTKLQLELKGIVLMDTGRQEYFREKVAEYEKKLKEMTSGDWADITQKDIEDIEKKIADFKALIHPQLVIINNRVYRIGEPLFGIEDLILTGLDRDHAHFEYLGEKVKKSLPKVLSATREKTSK